MGGEGTDRLLLRQALALLAVLTLLAVPIAPAGAQSGPPPDRGAPSFGDGQPGPPDFVDAELLVRFEPGTSPADRRAVRRRNDVQKIEDLPIEGLERVRILHGAAPPQRANQLQAEGSVVYAEPNFLLRPTAVTPDDPGFDEQWALHNTGQTGGTPDADLDAPEAWEVTSGSPDTVVAVIDSGVQIDHPDLAGNVWANPGEVAGNGVDDDGNGYVDDVNGWDFWNEDASVYDGDVSDAHGTHVAGTAAAVRDNGAGVAGVSGAQIMPLKFIGPDYGTTAGAVKAFEYLIDMRARGVDVVVANTSWGGSGTSSALSDAITDAGQAGVLVAAAAGNDGRDTDVDPFYPASYSHGNIISVAATDDRDGLASFSNYGDQTVDLGAPGVSIASTVPGGYQYYNGTSMAAPHVAGVVAEVAASYPQAGTTVIKTRVLDGADPASSLNGKTVTGRRLNLAGALDTAGAPALSGLAASPDPFSPDADGTADTTELAWTQNEPADVTVEVAPDGGGAAVRTEVLGARSAGSHAWTWDGTDDAGATVQSGTYQLTVTATDSVGTSSSASTGVTVEGPTVSSPYRDAVVGDSPLAFWRLGEASGSTAVDSVGGHDATYQGSPSLGAAGLIDGSDTAVGFDGTDDAVAVPDAADINLGGPYEQRTVELWFRASEVTSRQVLYEEGGGVRGLSVYVDAGRLYFGGWNRANDDGGATTPWQEFVSTRVSVGRLYHAVLVFDHTAGTLQGFVNGVSAGTASGVGKLFVHGGDVGIGSVAQDTYFHDGITGSGAGFAGTVDEVALYPSALGSARVQAHYEAGGGTVEVSPYRDAVVGDSPLAYWRLGEASGTTAMDSAGGNDATYQGSPSVGQAGLVTGSDTAVGFDGADDVVAVADAADINAAGPYETRTVELWFKASEVSSRQVLFEEGAGARGLNVYLDGGRLYFGGWNRNNDDGGATTPWEAFVSVPVAAGEVYHAVLVFDQPAGTLEGFVNGTSVGSSSGVGRLFGHSGDVGIGAVRQGTLFHDGTGGEANFFAGTLDEVALYPAALTASQIQTHHDVGTGSI